MDKIQLEVYVIDKGEDNIGLVTTRVGIGSTSEGLFFYSNGSNSGISSGLYNLTNIIKNK